MNAPKLPLTPAERLERAKAELANGGDPQYTIAHALVVIAELLVQQADKL